MKSRLNKPQPRRNSIGKFSSLLIRLTAVLLIVALLMPIVYFGDWQRVSAGTNLPIANTPAPLSAPPETFAFSSSSQLSNSVLSSVAAVNQSLINGYRSVSGVIVSPALPEGFARAKVPTVWENVSGLLASFASAYIAPLLVASSTAAATAPAAPLLYAQGTTKFDFDGDGKADASRWQSSSGEWKVKNSQYNSFSTLSLGAATAAAPADYDGDGVTDHATFTDWAGKWTIRKSSTSQIEYIEPFGQAGDKVVSGNYDGDVYNMADLAFWRPSNGTWYIRQSSDQQVVSVQFGAAGDVPVPGNYDGDTKMDYAVYRPSDNGFYVKQSSTGGVVFFQWGAGSDTPVPADYDGDGKTDFAVYRPSNGTWYINQSNGSFLTKIWGNYGDQPVPADYDGDGKDDFAVWRQTTGVWYVVKSSDPTLATYEYHQLGVAGDTAVPSAYLKQIGGQVLAYNLANARLAPKNATGGADLYSRNFSWETSLVNSPGRAGLDAGFGISYNSLVWTKEPTSNTMVFDADNSNVSPGFRFGFPTIEPSYYNALTQKFSYLMVTPSGGRVEFRQHAASNYYTAEDSSYASLVVPPGQQNLGAEDLTLVVTTTDGTRMIYVWRAGAYRCVEIKDRNGNFISIGYDSEHGLLRSLTDTLGRVVTVEYDTEFYPIAIKQNWKTNNGGVGGTTVAHTYATFGYGYTPISPNFAADLAVFGPSGGTNIKVLNQITYANGSSTTFNYNSYGQVYKIRNVAADSSAHVLNSVRTDLETPGGGQTDCPRFSKTYNYVENFNGGAETLVHNTLATNVTYTGGGGESLGTTDVAEVWMDVAGQNGIPDVHSKTWYHTAGNWTEGLPLGTEDIADGVRKRWTRTVWTQDDTTKTYKVNPRVVESRVGDETNTKITKIQYRMQPNTNASVYGLPIAVRVYDGADQTTPLKKAVTDYNLDQAYVELGIIGLPKEQRLYEGEISLQSKTTYGYDESDFSEPEQGVPSVIRHDTTNYSSSFIIGRGNRTSMTRHDVTGETAAVTSSVKYNTAGAVVKQLTPGTAVGTTREVKISYADAFNDNVNRNTYAYPTRLTAAGAAAGSEVSSYITYRYDIGANVLAESPNSAGAERAGKKTARDYDEKGRLERETVVNHGGAYTRYEYPTNGMQSLVFTTVNDKDGDGADQTDEVLTASFTDGAGRVLWSKTAHPGSTGGWSATRTEYDILGQVKRTSAPTEVNENWQPAGDGQTHGWLWTSQEYDWKGRTTKITETDGTFKTMSYDGCGCAGGEIVTIEGEQLADGKRKQRIYSDILGRQYKTEILNWNDTVYSTTLTKFNGRDQAAWVKQFAGRTTDNDLTSDSCPVQPATEPQSCQITKMTYDGHARLKTQHAPQQDAGKATVYDYFQNDEVQRVTDARGATATYAYNHRGLVSGINYAMPPEPNSLSYLPPWCDPDDECCLDPDSCTTQTSSPIGHLDGVNTSNWTVWGWSLDRDDPDVSNTIHIYIDGPAGSGTHIGTVLADKPRTDVNTATGYAGNHGFEFTIPNQYLDGGQHTIYAYGIDTGGDSPSLLYDSPRTFSLSPNTVQPPLDTSVAFEYDALGNRLSTTDNLGRTDYEYDGLSRLKSETRKFTDTLQNGDPLVMANAPLPNNSFKLQYTYGLANQLASLTDPYGAVVNYNYDQAGRLKKVSGTNFGNVSTYADNAEYQAWGGLKKLDYGSSLQMTMTYNNRLQAASYNLAGGASGQLMNKNYDYYADGSLRYVQNTLDAKFDRLNIYDHLGRIKEGKTGLEARGGTVAAADQSANLPYRQSYQFNAFNNLTQRNNLHWGIDSWGGQSNNLNYTYKNNRIQGTGWQYDADGRNLQSAAPDDYATSTYNAAGQMVRSMTEQTDAVRVYDGNGREVKRKTANFDGQNWILQPVKYYVRSSVLGGATVSEVWANGKKGKTFVRAAGSQLAYQSAHASDTAALNEAVIFEHTDASGMSQRTTDRTGAAVATGDGGDGSPVETDPLGNNIGTYTPYVEEPVIPYTPSPEYPMLQSYFDDAPMNVNGQRVSCQLDGMSIGCSSAMSMLQYGAADIDFARTSSWVLSQLGIVAIWQSDSGRTNPASASGNTSTISSGDDIIDGGNTYGDGGTWTYYFSNISWSVPRQTQQNAGGGFAQTRGSQINLPSKGAIQSAMQTCINAMFGGNGILVSDFTPSEAGIFGKIDFSYVEGENTPKSVTITNDTEKYSISDLNKMNTKSTIPKGIPIQTLGVTIGTQTTNYTARDVNSNAGGIGGNKSSRANFIAVQIHEFGHSLGNLFKKQHTVMDPFSGEVVETGQAFLNCVEVSLSEQRIRNGGFNQ